MKVDKLCKGCYFYNEKSNNCTAYGIRDHADCIKSLSDSMWGMQEQIVDQWLALSKARDSVIDAFSTLENIWKK